MKWTRELPFDLMEIGIIRRLVRLHFFQFIFVAVALAIFAIAAVSVIAGVKNPAFNFGMVFTWVVWWGLVILMFVIVGRGWCIMCPFGALGEWVQRLSLWWKRRWSLGFNFRWPRRLQNLWIAIAVFIGFIFLDNGYGISNSPALTTGLIAVLILGAILVNLLFERRTFCRYLCPLTAFIGVSSMAAPLEIRGRSAEKCRQCETKACFRGSENAYGCPMFVHHYEFAADEQGNPPCRIACPAGVNTSGYIALISQGRYREGVELHRQSHPFVAICGRVCTHPCEAACERAKADGPVSIMHLKRFMADYELGEAQERATPVPKTRTEKVAVIGGGPAGLACAYDLVRRGFPVTVFEAAPMAGGLVRYGIPEHRLPKAVLDKEIRYIEELGVEIRTNAPVTDVKDLFTQGYEAVFLATGAGRSQTMGIPNEDTEGVIHALDFLRLVNMGGRVELGQRVVVVGGGNAAVDAARTAQRLGVVDAARMAQRAGATEVSIIYRRSRAEMPAITTEVEEAEREGVNIRFLTAPVAILTGDGHVTGIRCVHMELGEPDASGRRRPVPVPGSEFDLDADNVIVAIGQSVDRAMMPDGVQYTDRETLWVDPVTRRTSLNGVFASGDVVTGPADVIGAIGEGKQAAISIERYLNGQDLGQGQTPPMERPASELREAAEAKARQRNVMPRLPLTKRGNFGEVELGLDEQTAIEEAKRCWNCGEYPEKLDHNRDCILCTECIKACPHDNVGIRVRQWGHDLWARAKGRLDESVAAVTIAGLVTMVSLFLVLFLPSVKPVMETVLPAGSPPNDWPRVVSVGVLYLGGLAAALLLMYGFSYLSRMFSGIRETGTKTFFTHFAYALIPLGVMKFLSDILDHVFRTWGAIPDVLTALAQDFPLNRVALEEVTVKQLLSASQTYVLQVVLIAIGFAASLYVAYRLAKRLSTDDEVVFRSFLPIGAYIFILGMAALWALSAAL